MNTELLQEFIKEVESSLPAIRGGILICSQQGNYNGELNAALNQIQTLKGAAAMIELEEVESTINEITSYLELFAGVKEPLNADQSRHILNKIAELESTIVNIKFAMDEFTEDEVDLDTSFDLMQGINEPTEADSFMDEEDNFEEFEIDEEMLEVFALEADDLLRNFQSNLEILENSPNNREALLEIRRNAHTLKGSAGIVGLKKLSKVAHRVEDLLDHLSEHEIESNEMIFQFLLSATDCFSSLANNENSDHLNSQIERLYAEFQMIMDSFANKKEEELTKQNSDAYFSDENQKAAYLATSQNDAEETEALNQQAVQQNRSIVRVSLEKLDDLVKIVSDLVINRSVFEQRLSELEQQIGELHNSTRRLQRATNKLETDFEADMLGSKSTSFNRPSSSEMPSLDLNDDNLLEFDTLEFDNYTEFHQTTRELIETTSDTASINNKLDTLRSNLEIQFDSQRRLIDEMQDKLLRLRMVKFGSLFNRLQRTVRVTSEEELKMVELTMEGENLEVDTQILDSLIEPLLHLLRNAIAHGIESPETRRILGKPEKGRIKLLAHSEGTHIILTVSDDGRGISAAALKEKAIAEGLIDFRSADDMSEEDALSLIFLPGLTTAEEISQVSGRGVGMNIVQTQIARQQGTITIDTELQKGSTFTVRLPMALAVTRALLVKVVEQRYAFPLKLVKHVTEVPASHLEKAKMDKQLQLGEKTYKLVHLNELLGMTTVPFEKNENVPVLLIDSSETSYALIVDKILKPEEIVIKPLGSPIKKSGELLGASILGDGKIVPVLDLLHLLTQKQQLKSVPKSFVQQPQIQLQTNVMIVDDSPSVRHMTSKIIKKADWNPIIAKDGIEALEILQNSRELPNIILTDVEMPRMDGYELLSSLKRLETYREIPVVMITSRAGEKHRQKAVSLGVSGYVVKPYKDTSLVGLIKKLAKTGD